MRIQNFNILWLLLTTSMVVGFFSCKRTNKENSKNDGSEKPNFLFILIDDLGSQDLGCYGNDFIETPNIDNLAEQGIRWSNAYSSCPVSSPTRVAILTGKNQARVNFTGHISAIRQHRHPEKSRILPPNDLMQIPKEEVILPEALKPAGYKSISIGKWHVGGKGYWPTDMGFDENVAGWTHGSPPSHFYPYENPDQPWNSSIPALEGGEEGEYLTDRLTDEAIRFIEENKDQPFLVYLSHYAVHTPLQAPEALVEKYKAKKEKTGNEIINPVYAAMVESVDINVGRLIEKLDEWDLSENTVVIFASDNGALDKMGDKRVADNRPYRSGKGHLYEGGLRVPYIMKWPGHIETGSVSETLTQSEDIYATIVDIAGVKAHANTPIDGRSLVSDFTDEDKVELHWYYPHYSPHGNKPGATIRSGKWKLIEFYDPKQVELYNLQKDPGENNDLSEEVPWKVQELSGKLHQWLHGMNPIMHTMNPEYEKDE
ncbi:MAG: sulfatase [Bacteroidales bacterium]|nr:sulfatase [Bacteroidales bacterium]